MIDQGSESYRPEILLPANDADGARVEQLSRMPGVRRIDTLNAQIADLVRTRHPGRHFTPAQLETAIEKFATDNGGDRYGAWIHYPWSQRLVRLLSEADFIELRTDRNKHKITAGEQFALAGRRIGIVGLSVGQSVALTMAMERICSQLRLADLDTIDLSNLNRLRCGVHNIGVPKTVAAAREIAELDPYLDVVCFSKGYDDSTADSFMDGLDLVVDECDSIDVKVELREAARERRIPLLMSTSDRGMIDIERFDLEPDRPTFHGRLDGISARELRDLSTEQKIPVLMKLAGVSDASLRLRASVLEIGHSIKTWPQLASDVTFGGAAICEVARRALLGQPVASGCYRLDFSALGDPDHALLLGSEDQPIRSSRSPDRAADAKDRILLDAIQAPSAGNSQPWQWRKTPDGLSLSLMPRNGPTVLYSGHRSDYVALGAALETAAISARHHGFHAVARIAVSGPEVAELQLAPGAGLGREPLYEQIARRRSIRERPANPLDIDDAARQRMELQVASVAGIQLRWLEGRDAIDELAGLVGEAERLRILDPVSHLEMIESELCRDELEHQARGTGIPLTSLALSAGELASLELIRDPRIISTLAQWNAGEGLSMLGRSIIKSSSSVGLLWSTSDTAAAYVDGGRALQRLWLQATADGIGMCPMTTLLCLLAAWRHDQLATQMQRDALPGLEQRFRALFDLPESRSDIAVFRLIPAPSAFQGERTTKRLALKAVMLHATG